MPAFDSPAYYAALDAPIFVDRTGKRHVGRILGADTYFRLHAKLRSPLRSDHTVNHRALDRLLREVVRAFFPCPWYRRRKPDSVEYWMWEMPYEGRMRAIWSFMQSQANAMGITMGQFPGTSPTSTPPTEDNRLALQTSGS